MPKRVTNTFKYENKEIWYLGLSSFEDGLGYIGMNMAVTPNHPFMVYGFTDDVTEVGELANPTIYQEPRWTRVDQLRVGDLVKSALNGRYYTVIAVKPFYKTFNEKLAYLQGGKQMVGWQGAEMGYRVFPNKVDFYGQIAIIDEEEWANSLIEPLEPEHSPAYPYYDRQGYTGAEASGIAYPLYTTDVYNIEVEDYHTYCVGGPGIIVHNQNCGKSVATRTVL
ncbi:hypothetical protein ACEYX6_08265 [Acinetobacter sp. c2-A9]|uniref:hypothetical protein n=1 Tax=Acinetobacter sp. c2-A9 TaxID=3342802 RepID=UPI0035B8153F